MKKLCVFLLVALTLCLSACSSSEEPAPEWYVYFPVNSYLDGPALSGQPLAVTDTAPTVEELIHALLEGPTDPNLYSPIPDNVTLRSWSLKDGLLYLNLSEQYGGLSGIQLTLADYSFVYTLCQLEEVDGVTLTVANDPMSFRHHQILTVDDTLLTDHPEQKD